MIVLLLLELIGAIALLLSVLFGVMLTLIDFVRLIYYSVFTALGFSKAKRMIDSEW